MEVIERPALLRMNGVPALFGGPLGMGSQPYRADLPQHLPSEPDRVGFLPSYFARLFLFFFVFPLPCNSEQMPVTSSPASDIPVVVVNPEHGAFQPQRVLTPAALQTCVTESTAPGTAPTQPISFKTRNHDQTCRISISESENIRLRRKGQFVDVRPEDEYSGARIPESINIPLHLVKTKPFLKTMDVVLIDNGRSTSHLEQSCLQLREAGFRSVSVLDGGIHAWQRSGRSLEGDSVVESRFDRMRADELFAERLYADWLILDASAKGIPEDLRAWFPGNVVRINKKTVNDQIAAIREQLTKHQKRSPRISTLLLSDSDEHYDRLSATLGAKSPNSLLYLEGGVDGYRHYVSQQLAMWSEQGQPRRLPSCRG